MKGSILFALFITFVNGQGHSEEFCECISLKNVNNINSMGLICICPSVRPSTAYGSTKTWGIQINFESDHKMSWTYILDNILHDSHKIMFLYQLALEQI